MQSGSLQQSFASDSIIFLNIYICTQSAFFLQLIWVSRSKPKNRCTFYKSEFSPTLKVSPGLAEMFQFWLTPLLRTACIWGGGHGELGKQIARQDWGEADEKDIDVKGY